jgi:hypothetical protein
MRTLRCLNVALVALVYSFAPVFYADAGEVRTYRIASDQPRLLRFAGGLFGYDVSAQLAGSFDVEIEAGSATLTRFDVSIIDIVDQGLANTGWSNGQSLAPLLFVNPVGLTGVHDSTLTYLSSQPYPPPLLRNGPATTITLVPDSGPWARLNIVSLPTVFLDNPSFHTDAPTDVLTPGFLVRLVPEPSACSIAFVAAMAVILKARRKHA